MLVPKTGDTIVQDGKFQVRRCIPLTAGGLGGDLVSGDWGSAGDEQNPMANPMEQLSGIRTFS